MQLTRNEKQETHQEMR